MDTYYYYTWGFMGVIVGLTIGFIFGAVFLYVKFNSFENILRELATRVSLVEDRSKAYAMIETSLKDLYASQSIIEERTRLLQDIPAIEERSRMIPWFLNYALTGAQHEELDTDETQRIPKVDIRT